MTSPHHTCITHPTLTCLACEFIIHQSEVQSVEYRRSRTSETTIEIEDDLEQARR